MRSVKFAIVTTLLSVLPTASALGQTQAQSKLPATPTPATPTTLQVPIKPHTPVTFPVDAKYAVIDPQAVASASTIGKEASKRLNDLQAKEAAGIQEKSKELQALQAKRDTGGAVLSDAARTQLEKDIEKLQRDIQFAQSTAQAEMQDLNNELTTDFTKKVEAAVQEIAKEKGLYIVFSADASLAYAAPEINISDEVVRRLDAKQK